MTYNHIDIFFMGKMMINQWIWGWFLRSVGDFVPFSSHRFPTDFRLVFGLSHCNTWFSHGKTFFARVSRQRPARNLRRWWSLGRSDHLRPFSLTLDGTLWLWLTSPWYRWPIEIDGLPIKHGWIFPWRTVSHNQMVIFNLKRLITWLSVISASRWANTKAWFNHYRHWQLCFLIVTGMYSVTACVSLWLSMFCWWHPSR